MIRGGTLDMSSSAMITPSCWKKCWPILPWACSSNPKVPRTLRKRLGPVAELLARAEATGRCYVFETGVLHGSFPPAVAAMAADIAVHQELWAATAGLEAALAGVPTLLLDRDGWSSSPLYQLGEGGARAALYFMIGPVYGRHAKSTGLVLGASPGWVIGRFYWMNSTPSGTVVRPNAWGPT